MTPKEFESLPTDSDGYKEVEYAGDRYETRRLIKTGLGKVVVDLHPLEGENRGVSIRRNLSEVRAPRG